jgi:preprotein translocase subunit SecD
MRGNNALGLIITVLIITLFTYIAAFGLNLFGWEIPGVNDIRFGTDIRGGVNAILYPDVENPSEEDLETARTIIKKRLDGKGIFDREVTTETENGRIIVSIPWGKGETDFNPQATIDDIGKTALLTFQEVDEDKLDENGDPLPTGRIVIQGTDVKDTGVAKHPDTGQIVVVLELTEEGGKKFEEATGRLIGKPIAIFMDDQFISDPVVQTKISGGTATIEGNFTPKEAGELAYIIKSGALPFRLEAKQVNSISPTLGENALSVTILAGFVSLILVFLYMILYYRLPGLLSCIALLGLVAGQLLIISWAGITLTLPGIAGIILSIGTGVDANVIINERIKEELKSGKTLGASVELGFKRAFTAILDSNVTTLMSAAVLYVLGTGPIKGFAVTLFLGVMLSFLTAIAASKIMVRSTTSLSFAKNKWLYGA